MQELTHSHIHICAVVNDNPTTFKAFGAAGLLLVQGFTWGALVARYIYLAFFTEGGELVRNSQSQSSSKYNCTHASQVNVGSASATVARTTPSGSIQSKSPMASANGNANGSRNQMTASVSAKVHPEPAAQDNAVTKLP